MGRVNNMLKHMALIVIGLGFWLNAQNVYAHCDTMSGPVVNAARIALDKKDVTPVLMWVRKDDEKEIRDLFNKTLTVRTKGPEAKEMADQYFFETLVRIHRAGEGAPYTGLKSEMTEPIIQAADTALESGTADHVVKHMSEAVAAGIVERFKRVKEAKKHANESVKQGREFVAAYVEYTHYIERLHMDATAAGAHHGEMAKEAASEHHH